MGSYLGTDPVLQKDAQNRGQYSAADGQTTFAAIYTPGYIDIYQNGNKLKVGTDVTDQNGNKLQVETDVTASTGTNFVLATPATLGDIVEYVAFTASAPWDVYTKAAADIRNGNFYSVAVGSGDAMSVTTTPAIPALVDGLELKIRTPSSNSAINPTITIVGLGVSKTVYKYGGQPVQPGEWGTGHEITVRYNITGDRFELVSNSLGVNKVTLVDGANISWDVNQGVIATLTLGAAGRTMINPTNLKPGTLILIVKQDSTGSRTITTWGSVFKWSSGTPPILSTAANATDVISFICDGTFLYGTSAKGFA